ncbi:hypothetical protein Dda_7852 [Drechslerella dactyloides]|uniref:Uncharacterized protein n=1 Tax=Drechslerella dactyloides TaxID=74499 RepID=A0AAD6IS74_DREDA|nr:hypothetical protein Dda_7852 [Drechslerella dactyloides]
MPGIRKAPDSMKAAKHVPFLRAPLPCLLTKVMQCKAMLESSAGSRIGAST